VEPSLFGYRVKPGMTIAWGRGIHRYGNFIYLEANPLARRTRAKSCSLFQIARSARRASGWERTSAGIACRRYRNVAIPNFPLAF